MKNLPYECTEDDVREGLKECGKIVQVRLASWGHTGKQKGFGYVDFSKEESAQIAVKKSGKLTVKGRYVAGILHDLSSLFSNSCCSQKL